MTQLLTAYCLFALVMIIEKFNSSCSMKKKIYIYIYIYISDFS